MSSLPTGTLTFLFTDIEGSTKLWEAHPEVMRAAVARHDALLRQAVADNNGNLFKTTGDGIAAVFALAPDALAAAIAAQQALLAEPWPKPIVLRARIGLHTGTAEMRDGDYFGTTLNRCARLMAAGHGGQTLLSDVAHDLTRDALPPDVSLVALGEHRLKDLARPENVYQLAHPALTAEFPPLRTLDNPDTPNNLPQQVTSFIGREAVMADVRLLLGKTRVLTLTGSGGAGKTRLSLQVAADVLEQYQGGVWLVELASLADPGLVPQTVASVLGIKEQAGQTITQTLIAALKGKALLLLLDNCEHLLSACATLVAALIRACPNVTVLATSREPLGIGGETAYRVPSLSLPDAKASRMATPISLSQFESVRLFIERAQAVKPDFAVTNQSAPALAQLCFRLDGIPLAIELGAARVRSLAVEQINDRLDSRFRLLTGGDRSALPRQQTLRALIDWSYDLLTEGEKTFLARLSVFAGGWTLEAAESVCGFDPLEDSEVLDLLTSLADKSLVLCEETAGDQATRYRMLETIRQYGAERLAAGGKGSTVRERHVGFFVTLAEEAAPQLQGPDQVRWLNRLETEHDNLRAALDDCAAETTGSAPGAATFALSGLRLSGRLVGFWDVRGHLTEGRAHLARALAGRDAAERGASAGSIEAIAVTKEVGGALLAAGRAALHQGDNLAAHSLLEESLVLNREIGDKSGIANVLMSLGFVASNQGDYAYARSFYAESLVLYREIGDRSGIARALLNLGIVASNQGDYAGARSFYAESLVLQREIGGKSGIAYALINLGNVALRQGDYAGARSLYVESLVLQREIGGKYGIAYALINVGNVALRQGDYAYARSLYEESLVLCREIGDKYGIAYALMSMAEAVALGENDVPRGTMLWAASCSLRENIGLTLSPREQADLDASMAKARVALGDGAAWEAAWAEGAALSLDAAIELALRK